MAVCGAWGKEAQERVEISEELLEALTAYERPQLRWMQSLYACSTTELPSHDSIEIPESAWLHAIQRLYQQESEE